MSIIPKTYLKKTLAAFIGVMIAVALSELVLTHYADYVNRSEKMDPGLIQQNKLLGWDLQPDWRGQHQHMDYDVHYNIAFNGVRTSPNRVGLQPIGLVVGDSFTFGLGVEDNETFTSLLNSDGVNQYVNGGIPGYSPEQNTLRALLLSKNSNPKILIFSVYLGNDLLDIGEEFPIQADYGKPYLHINEKGQIKITNSPVRRAQKPASLKQITSADRIMDNSGAFPWSSLRIWQFLTNTGLVSAQMNLDHDKFEHSLLLFEEILRTLSHRYTAEKVVLLAIPGSSTQSAKRSFASMYQHQLNARLNEIAKRQKMTFVDLLDVFDKSDESLFFPNDGHLNPEGHKVVADTLIQKLKGRL